MNDDIKVRLREAIMETFRGWGGQWNVSAVPPGAGAAPPDRWLVRIHSHPFTRGELPAELVEAYLADPAGAETSERWEAELRSLFDRAREQAP